MDQESLRSLQEVLGIDASVSTDTLTELEEVGDVRYIEVITPLLPKLVQNSLEWKNMLASEDSQPQPLSRKPLLRLMGVADLTEEISIIYFEDINSSAPKLD